MKKLSKSALRSSDNSWISQMSVHFQSHKSPTRWFKTRERDEVMVKVMKMSS